MEIIAIRLPILILGLNGVPGFALFRHFNKLYGSVTVRENVPGIIGIRPIKHPCVFGENVFGVDAEETERLGELFKKYRFGTVIDASGNCALKACECDPARSRLLNYSQGVDAATFAARYNATLIRISADMVFSGDEKTKPNRPYVETDPKDPIHNYGKHQAEAEDAITAIKPDVVILRVPLPMDYAPGGCAGAIDWITYRFRPGRPATLFTDEYRNPLSGPDLCRTVQYILEHKFPAGIYNCGGPRRVSLYNVGQIVNAVGGYPAELLHGVPRIEGGPMPPRVGDISINSEKLYKLLPPGFIKPWPAFDWLVPDSFDWHKTFGRNIKDKRKMGCDEAITNLLVNGVNTFFIRELGGTRA